jgi:hypothetical protein
MLTSRDGAPTRKPQRTSSAILLLLSMLLNVGTGFSLQAAGARQESPQATSQGHQIVLLLDVNPDQKNVLTIEKTLAEGVVKKLGESRSVFSIITFGAQAPTLLRSRVPMDEAVAALQEVRLGQPSGGYLSVELYNALDFALDQFTDDRRLKSLLVITEGNDYPRGETIKHVVSRALQLQVTCSVAMVAEHTFYGSKSIQKYGFYLRRLAGKTGGRYVEVGSGQKRVSSSIGPLSDRMLRECRR